MSKKTETRPATGHINPFGLRMQPELRAKLEEAANFRGRSLNAEIVQRLEDSFLRDREQSYGLLTKAMDAIRSTETAIANMEADIKLFTAGDRKVLQWVHQDGKTHSDEAVLEMASNMNAILKSELDKIRSFIPTLVGVAKDGGPIPDEVYRFLSRA